MGYFIVCVAILIGTGAIASTLEKCTRAIIKAIRESK
jgi:hypothetical protein